MMVLGVGIMSGDVRSYGRPRPDGRSGLGSRLSKCLVVSGDEGLRRRLESMAELADWSVCEAPTDAADLGSLVEGDFNLVITDIANPLGERVSDTVEVAEEFAGRPNTLVVVCGSGESVDEELWARQLGAWVYLPGVASGDSLMSLFVEAQRVAARRPVFEFVQQAV